MPPSAALNRPSRFFIAPVNAPRSCPNSSASINVSAIAPQFTATNGLSRRALDWWMMRATTSFPVPLSPVTSAGASLCATMWLFSITRRIAGESPI